MSSTFFPVQPHGSVQQILPDIHWVQGSIAMGPGVRIPRNMVVLHHEGELCIVDSVRLDAQGIAALESLGTVRHVMKIGLHGVDDAWYLDRYEAKMWALPGVTHGEGVATDVEIAVGGEMPVPWLSPFVFEQTKKPECALLADRGDGLLITCDSVQHWPDLDGCSFLAKGVTMAMGFKHAANIGPPWRKMMTPEGGSLKPDFERLLGLRFDSVVGGHGKPMIGGAKMALRATVRRVLG